MEGLRGSECRRERRKCRVTRFEFMDTGKVGGKEGGLETGTKGIVT